MAEAGDASAFLERVKNGDADALAMAATQLAHGNAQRRQLLEALQEALIVKPIAVVSAVPGDRELRLVCGVSVQETYDLAQNSLDERESAVLTAGLQVRDSELSRRLDLCANELAKAARPRPDDTGAR